MPSRAASVANAETNDACVYPAAWRNGTSFFTSSLTIRAWSVTVSGYGRQVAARGNVRLNVRPPSDRDTSLGAGLGSTPPRAKGRGSMTTIHERAAHEDPCPKPEAGTGPSQELLDRARVGWERFLDTFEAASDEKLYECVPTASCTAVSVTSRPVPKVS